MPLSDITNDGSAKRASSDRAAEIANTFEWIITAFILAFVFRGFVMEAFRIPTGSMASTLMGAHYQLRCSQCGYRYNHGYGNYTVSQGNVSTEYSRCPSCGNYQLTGGNMPVSNGDRILVLKCIYQFFYPEQWDVIVFKNPLDPNINFIKRLIGRPEEKVEIIDGDVYINDLISRKPPKVQEELWMPVYENDYQPVRPEEKTFNYERKWEHPFNLAGSKWQIDKNRTTVLTLDSAATEENTFFYDTSRGNDFRANYAYGDVDKYLSLPYCSDLMVRFYVSSQSEQGKIGISLSKYNITYKAWVDLGSGEMFISKIDQGQEEILKTGSFDISATKELTLAKFANVDHQLILQFGKSELIKDLGRSADSAGERATEVEPRVKIFGSGKLELSHAAIFRDIHYTRGVGSSRASEGDPLQLGKDEFFVLGDNSPNSEDGRFWSSRGVGNNGETFNKGIVPRQYLVGKALYVYWPSFFRPYEKSRFIFVPNFGQVRFIDGGIKTQVEKK